MNRNNYRNYSVIIVLVGLIFALAAIGVLAANQVKTTETLITSGDSSVSSATSSAFSLYIGDNLTGVSNPVKSAQVAVSGVYTGNGTITVQLGSDSQTFTMANASSPTPFEILYNATGTTDAITSAGTYTYALYVTPSDVTIYGLGAKLVESHEYVPASCADGDPDNEKVKTTETFITSYEGTITNPTGT